MSKRNSNVGFEINDTDLGRVQGGGVTVATEGDYNYKVDLKPLWETAKYVWKKFSSWF